MQFGEITAQPCHFQIWEMGLWKVKGLAQGRAGGGPTRAFWIQLQGSGHGAAQPITFPLLKVRKWKGTTSLFNRTCLTENSYC